MPNKTQLDDSKLNILHTVSVLIIVFGICLLIVCYSHTNYFLNNVSNTAVIEPETVETLDDGSTVYTFDLAKVKDKSDRVRFYAAHQFVKAYVDEQLMYSYLQDGGIWCSSPGSTFHFVPFRETNSVMKVVLTPAYDAVKNQQVEFYTGSCETLEKELMQASLPRFIASILMILISVGLMIYYLFMVQKQQLSRDMFYLAIFSCIMGTWSINETDLCALITENHIFDCLVPYITIMLIVPPFIMFIYGYLGLADKYIHRIIIWLCCVNFVVLTILHFTKIAEYRETLPVMQFVLVIAALYLFGAVLIKIIKRQYSRRLQICVIGLGMFSFAMIVDLVAYYRELGDADKFGRYCYVIFIVMLTWDLVKGTNEIINKGRRAKELEVFAITDSMTGLYNRNAYEMHVARTRELDGVSVLLADINNLKATNDTYGHTAGDDYITEVAEIIADVCGRLGNCYRIGGDEFCVIMDGVSKLHIELAVKSIKTRVESLNNKNEYPFIFGVAVGAATYSPELETNFDQLIKRADAKMYEDKRKIKEKPESYRQGLF